VEHVAEAAQAQGPSAASQLDHQRPVETLLAAFDESGDFARAGRVASQFRALRSAWKNKDFGFDGELIAAVVRGDGMDQKEANRRLDADFKASVEAGQGPAEAWASVYATGVTTRDEAIGALAKLDALREKNTPG